MKKNKWGIVAPGTIAHSFAAALRTAEDSVCYAVSSRSIERARTFAGNFGFEKVCASYNELFADPEVDIVYIASPHSSHKDLSIAALRAGKHVLCEKPAALTAMEVSEVIAAARASGRFYMEAMWMKFNPAVGTAMRWIREGRIGTPLLVKSDFCIFRTPDTAPRLFDPALGGGALLDTGIYPVTFAEITAGALKDMKVSGNTIQSLPCIRPEKIFTSVRRGPAGIDLYESMIFIWNSGLMGQLSAAIDIEGDVGLKGAYIAGTKGKISLPFFWQAEKIELYDTADVLAETADCPFTKNGYEYEIAEVNRCVRAGLAESSIHTHADTLAVMETLGAVKALWPASSH